MPPEIGNLINLQYLNCFNNNLTTLQPEIGNLINLQYFYCSSNNLTTWAPEICHLINLREFYYSNNPIEYINPQIIKFLNRINSVHEIYNDAQSVHNHNIQEGIKNGIQYIMSIKSETNIQMIKQFI